MIDDPGVPAPIWISALFPLEVEKLDWAEMRAAFCVVLRVHSDREFFAPPIFPEEFGREILAPLGFQQEPLCQFLMRRDL